MVVKRFSRIFIMSWNSKEPSWHGRKKPRVNPAQFITEVRRVPYGTANLLGCDPEPEVQKKERWQLDALCHSILSHHGQLEWGAPWS